MENFILFAATRFGISPADARVLAGAVLWVMQLRVGDDFACVHALDAEVRRLVERAPSAVARARRDGGERGDHSVVGQHGRGRVCGTQAALLRLFAQYGFSLARAGRFARALLGWLSAEVGAFVLQDMVDRTPVLLLLLGPVEQRDSRPLAGPLYRPEERLSMSA
jgi:hypothetical protein